MRTTHYARRLPPHRRPHFDTPLAIWLKTRGVSAYALAKQIGADPKSVDAWRDGRQMPNLISAFKIQQATADGVPASAWLGTELGKHLWDTYGMDWKNWMEKKEQARSRSKRRG